jgi:hypothetical protein
MGIYTVCFVGMMPFGALLAGWLAQLVSNQFVLQLSAVLLAAAATGVWIVWRRLDRTPRRTMFGTRV